MEKNRVLQVFEETGVLQEGHFLLTSGRHSDRYMQCAKVLQHPKYAEELCAALAEKFRAAGIDVCVGPAMGGIIVAYETARRLGCRALFAERDASGAMTLRRGFHIEPGEKVLVLEDVITTGGSVQEVIDLVKSMGAHVAGVGVLVDRSGGKADFGVPLVSLLEMDINTYSPEECPLCARGVPAVKPGSRKQI